MDHRAGVSPIPPLHDGQSPHTPAAQLSALQGRSQIPRQHAPVVPPYPLTQPNRQPHPIPQASQPSPYPTGTPTQPYVTPHNFPTYQAPRIPVPPMAPHVYNPNAPKPIETFHLRDNSNVRVPPDIREHFQCDNKGRVVFFSTPPLDIVATGHQGLGHSIRYLAAKEERQKRIAEKKKQEAAKQQQSDAEAAAKRQKTEEAANYQEQINNLTKDAWNSLSEKINEGTKEFYNLHYGDSAASLMALDRQRNRELQDAEKAKATKARPNHDIWESFTSLKRSWMSRDDIS